MLDQLFKKCSEPLGDIIYKPRSLGDNGCLGRDGFLGIERAGAGGRGRKKG
jgi:hypothetical protein